MKSKIYEGFVEHTRHRPTVHRFRYPIYVYGLYLDELAQLDRRLPFFGYNRVRPASVHDADYLDAGPGGIREKLMRFLPEDARAETASVMLVTSARYLNYVFNPVSFYYCFDAGGAVSAMVVEVNNTFGERHVYVPDADPGASTPESMRYAAKKAFHVSPFNDLEGNYEFLFSPPGDELDVRIHLVKENEPLFEARLWGRGRALTRAGHLRMLARHPAIPHLTKPRIFLEAARLYFLRHLPYHPKPDPVSPMTIRRKR